MDLSGAVKKILDNKKIVAAILAAACFLVYANALHNRFVWDDEEQVVNNTVIRDWDNFPLIFTSSTFYAGGAGLSGGFYRPLVTLSYFWNYSYWGLNPFGYHLMQLLFHAANAFLVFYLLDLVFRKNSIAAGRGIAFCAALFFAVHPANVESVSYVGSIGEVAYVFLSLLGLVFLVLSVDHDGSLSKPKFFWLSFILVFLGLLAKESAIIVLFVMLVYLLLFVRLRRELYFKFVAGSFLVVAWYLFLRVGVAKIQAIPNHYAPIYFAPLYQRLLTVPGEIFSYLELVFYPKDLSISRHFVVSSAADPRFWQPLLFLLLVAVVTVLYIFKTRSKVFSFFILWFGLSLGPVLNIIPLDMTMAERWLYFPMVGLLAAVIFAVSDSAKRMPPVLLAALFFVCLVFLGGRAIERNKDWQNGLALYGHDITLEQKISPQGSFDLENNYGVELFRAGEYGQAGEHFKRSIELQPKWASSQNNYGAVLERDGNFDGALKQYRIAADMGYYLAYENIAGMLIKNKKYDDAKNFLEGSLAKFPDNGRLQYYLAFLYAADNIDNAADSKQKAAYLLERVLRADPQNQQAQYLYLMLKNSKAIEI